MKRSTRKAFALLSGLSLSLAVSACGPIPVREYNAVRWIKSDSLLAYLFHSFEVEGTGGSLGRPADNSYPYSMITLYQIALDSTAGLHGQTMLYHDDNAVPCGELEYLPEDSLLFFSYLVADGSNGILRHDCGQGPRRLALGKLVEDRWEPVTDSTVDTAHFLSLLTAGRGVTESGLAIDSANERLCANGWCIRPLKR